MSGFIRHRMTTGTICNRYGATIGSNFGNRALFVKQGLTGRNTVPPAGDTEREAENFSACAPPGAKAPCRAAAFDRTVAGPWFTGMVIRPGAAPTTAPAQPIEIRPVRR